jgi:hypothetical protein
MSKASQSVPERLRYLARSTAVIARNPAEGFDRIRGRAEILVDERLHPVPDRSLFAPVDDSLEALHAALGVEGTCPFGASFDKAWEELDARLSALGLPTGLGHDADGNFARVVWCTVLHLGATRVLETGVARGVTSALVLQALSEHGGGHLWSVDLPPVKPVWREQGGVAVPAELRDSWSYIRGSSRRRLPLLLTGISELDIFIHDSLHTAPTMRFEMEQAWGHLRDGGVLIADDVEGNSSFVDFVAGRHDVKASFCADQQVKRGMFGLAVKTGG